MLTAEAPPAPPSRLRRAVVVVVVAVLAGAAALWWTGREGDDHAFLRTQPDGTTPVSWDPCRAIPYAVNTDGAPTGWRALLEAALAEVSAASGYVFRDTGTTANRTLATPSDPVLVLCSHQGRRHDLQGSVAGLGGPVATDVQGLARWTSGGVILDQAEYQQLEREGDEVAARMILVHEILHVLGLGHVDDEDQLMNASYVGQDRLGDGDVAGLRALHDQPCASR
ncbi:matrixin family metalloprotease [Nocardioides sp. SYSU D00038]|uniref:matrixin family metalloprotease n=1 Tax=Nocardioides sp. SYSU D00038 TaxID=2812554 RepID=UPI0019679CC6|nr:matrixin family metalloprotease [Nocardioides sp. SYSU D00038]